jgi:hypothetical protein
MNFSGLEARRMTTPRDRQTAPTWLAMSTPRRSKVVPGAYRRALR